LYLLHAVVLRHASPVFLAVCNGFSHSLFILGAAGKGGPVESAVFFLPMLKPYNTM
jgi:hypothetical protein